MVFKSEKQKRKSKAVSLGQKRRWLNNNIENDHSYLSTPDISIVTQEEIVDFNGNNISPDIAAWRDGRRIVELGVLADGLSGCQKCGLPLSLQNCVSINTHGLAATLKIMCVNTVCQYTNCIPTGKKHGQVWDVNTKLAAGN